MHARIAPRVGRGLAVLGAVLAAALDCAPTAAKPQLEAAPIEIVSPAKPLALVVAVRGGSFAGSHVNPEGIQVEFVDVLKAARIFSEVRDSVPDSGPPVLELRLAASDYGEQGAYTLEMQVALVRKRELLTTYFSKQSVRGGSSKAQLTVGPEELGALAQRAIRDLIRQLAADSEKLARL